MLKAIPSPKTKDWIKNIAERESAGETINYESMGEQGANIQQMVSTTKTLAKDYGYSWEQAAEGSLTGSISKGSPGKELFGFGVSITADGKISARNSSSQAFSERDATNQENLVIENMNNVSKAAKNHSYSKDTSIDKTSSESVRSAYEEQERSEKALSRSRHEADSWQRAQNLVESSGGSSSKDITRELIDRYMKDTGINDRVLAHKHVSDRTPDALRVWNKMQMEDGYVESLVHNISNNKSHLQSNPNLDHFSDSTELHSGKYNEYVDSKSSDAGLTTRDAGHYITESKSSLSDKYNNIIEHNYGQKSGIKGGINAINQGIQNKVDKFEGDRIGQGAASTIGGALNFVSDGRASSVLGGPSKNESVLNQDINPTSESYKDLEDIGPTVRSYTGTVRK